MAVILGQMAFTKTPTPDPGSRHGKPRLATPRPAAQRAGKPLGQKTTKPAAKGIAKKTATAVKKKATSRTVRFKRVASVATHDTSIIPIYDHLTAGDLVVTVRRGLPVAAVDEILDSGAITVDELYEAVLPRKTLSNRRGAGTLTPDQSDKLIRVARVIARAEQTFGSPEKAHMWLRRPTTPLKGEEPMKLLDTEAGARQVEDLLTKIDHGIAA
jgi:putative toxin-antitoxin system antitoxin component (TIGR02293 family)